MAGPLNLLTERRTPDQVLREEAYSWARALTDAECERWYVVGADVNMAFVAAANRLTVGLCAPVHVQRPAFGKKLAGSWLGDLSHIELGACAQPLHPDRRPAGPAWYATDRGLRGGARLRRRLAAVATDCRNEPGAEGGGEVYPAG